MVFKQFKKFSTNWYQAFCEQHKLAYRRNQGSKKKIQKIQIKVPGFKPVKIEIQPTQEIEDD